MVGSLSIIRKVSTRQGGTRLQIQQQLGLRIPRAVTGVEPTVLNPRNTWDKAEEYDVAAAKLRALFQDTFAEKGYETLGISARM